MLSATRLHPCLHRRPTQQSTTPCLIPGGVSVSYRSSAKLLQSLQQQVTEAPGFSGRGASCSTRVFNKPGGGDDTSDRVIASLPYLLPLLDAFPFAKFMMMQYPFIARGFAPLGPLMAIYHSFPFAPFLIFLGIYNGIVNNQNLPRFVRYNAMQAVLLDILLIIPQVILENVIKVPNDELAFQAYISANNTIFLFVAVCTAYGMGSCLVGQTPRLPLVADAAESQMRGF